MMILSPFVIGALPAAVHAQNEQADRAMASHPYARHVADAAQRFGIPEAWIWAVMRVESNGTSRAISSAGAMGLMQIMPGTWAGLQTRHGLGSDPYDVRDNIMAGAAYLRAMYDRYGNVTAMFAAYNAGPGRYDEHLSRGRPLPGETRAYLTKLAAITGSAGESQLATVPPSDPFAWRRAALFAVRPGDTWAAQKATPDNTEEHALNAPSDGMGQPAHGLFVPLSGIGNHERQ